MTDAKTMKVSAKFMLGYVTKNISQQNKTPALLHLCCEFLNVIWTLMRFNCTQMELRWGRTLEVRKLRFKLRGLGSDWPALSSSGALPDLWICRWSLALLRYSQAAPPCFGRSKVSSSPALFHVRNWSPTDVPNDDGSVTPDNQRKLWGLVNVMATKTGSVQEKVTLP